MTTNFVQLVKHQFMIGASVREAAEALRVTNPFTTKAMVSFWYNRFDKEQNTNP